MKKIGKHIVQSKIGEGGMGAIYKAFDPYFERVVAIKVMSAQLAADEDFRRRFFREARSTAKLNHPSIVAVYELGEEDGIPYLVMEYLEGRDLKAMILDQASTPLEEKLRIMTEVCRGLAHAHDRGVIHRDVKPGNIFVTDSGPVKLLDFGLARVVSSATVTTKGAILGTPSYMSPEQWADSKVDLRSDVFGAGAVFYELLARRRAFDGDTYEKVFYNIFHCDPQALEDTNPALPPDLCRIVHRSLAKDVTDRYQNMHELLADLEECGDRLSLTKSRLKRDLDEIIGRTGRMVAENSELLEGSLAPEAPPDSENQDYLRLVELVRKGAEDFDRIEALVEKRKPLAPRVQEAAALEDRGELDPALGVIAAVLDADPTFARALLVGQRLRSRIETIHEEKERALQAERLMERASELLSRDDPGGSLDFLEQILRLVPGHGAARALQEKALGRQQELLRLEGESQRRAGLAMFGEGRCRDSLAALVRARNLLGDDPELMATIAEAEAAVRAEDERLHRASELEEARALFIRGDFSASRDPVLRVLENNPEDAVARDLLAEIDRNLDEERRRGKVAALLAQSRQALVRRDSETAGTKVEEALLLDAESRDALNLRNEVLAARQSSFRRAILRKRIAWVIVVAILISVLAWLFYESRARSLKRQQTDGTATARAADSPVAAQEPPGPSRSVGMEDPTKQMEAKSTPDQLPGAPVVPTDRPAVLLLSTNPAVSGAAVRVNGVNLGTTDSSGAFSAAVKPGAAQIVEVEKAGYQRFVRSVPSLKSEESRSFPVELVPLPRPRTTATLNITSEPTDAVVYVDGDTQGHTPVQIKVPSGPHKIEVKKTGYRTRERTSEWGAADYNLEFAMEKETGTLQFNIDPPGATAAVDGQNYTPDIQKRISLPPGQYNVVLSKDGYATAEHQVGIVDGQTTPLAARLIRLPPPSVEFGDSFLNLVNWDTPLAWRADKQALVARGAGTGWLRDRIFGDFTLRFSIRMANGIAASWILRAKTPTDYYRVELRGDAYRETRLRNTIAFYICRGGKEAEAKSLPIPIETRKMRDWFQTFVEARDNRVLVTVSGTLLSGTKQEKWTLGDFSDPQNLCTAGKIGFRVSGTEVFEVNGLLVVPSR